MRTCPTVQGSPSPLITHRIGVDVCQARQATFFHKCHRCVYRGKPVDWEPAEPPALTIELEAPAGGKNGAVPARKPNRKKKPAKSAGTPRRGTLGKPAKVVETEA